MPGFWARPGPRSPKTWHICSFPLCTTATARPHVPEWGEPRDRPRPQSKTHFLRKEFITQNRALILQFLPAPFLLPTPNERRDQMCQVSLPAPQQRQGQMCRNGGEPRDRAPTPIKNALFTKRIYHSKSGPDFSIFARSLLLPPPPYTQ